MSSHALVGLHAPAKTAWRGRRIWWAQFEFPARELRQLSPAKRSRISARPAHQFAQSAPFMRKR
jgi:hypothetical protein